MRAFIPLNALPTLRRLLPAVVLASAATLAGSAGEPASACASPKWNQAEFDACYDPIADAYLHGDITPTQHDDLLEGCCQIHGGHYDPFDNVCRAPAIVAETSVAAPSEVANPDVPAGPPATPTTKPGPKPPTPKTSLTLAPIAQPVG